ncbi:hypothetical protein HK097_001550, partial [Rhizophlyctis rosea]
VPVAQAAVPTSPYPAAQFLQANWFGRSAQRVICPNCNHEVTTKAKLEDGLCVWLSAGACLAVGCWLGCCFIPFCVDELKDVEHHCPNCNALVGKNKKINSVLK